MAVSYLTYSGLPHYRALLQGPSPVSTDDAVATFAELTRTIETHLRGLRERTRAPILVHNASGLPLERLRRHAPFLAPIAPRKARALAALNARLAAIVTSIPGVILVDEAAIASSLGIRHCDAPLLPRHIRRAAALHPTALGQALADHYLRTLRELADLRRVKVIAVDLDETLWQGVVAEGPVLHHHERQSMLRDLKSRGYLLATVSKNAPENVPWDDMRVAPDDFVAHKIGWRAKVDSIAELADELGLATDSILFLDDSPQERAMVAEQFPDILLLDGASESSWKSVSHLRSLGTQLASTVAESRTRLYRDRAERQAVLQGEASHPRLLASLGLIGHIGIARPRDLARVEELLDRTHQFNTTGLRLDVDELQLLRAKRGGEIYVGELEDRLGHFGLVVAALVRRHDDEASIENLVLSCRAMGFGMDQAILALVIRREASRRIVARFCPSARNMPASSVFADAGFVGDGQGMWTLAAERVHATPEWLELRERV